MEDYYGLPQDEKLKDIRPQLSYQVGATPANVERARADNCNYVEEKLQGANKPITLCPPGKDPKWRYFWRIGCVSRKATPLTVRRHCVCMPPHSG